MKFIQTLLFIFVFGFPRVVLAQNAPIVKFDTITVSASSADVAITVKNFNNIKSFDLKISYDSSVTIPTSITRGTELNGSLSYDSSVTIPTSITKGTELNGSLSYDLGTQGIIKLIWNAPLAAVSSLANGAELLKISFDKVGVGSSVLGFDESNDLYDCQFYSLDGALYDIPAENYYAPGLLTFNEIQCPITRAPHLHATVGSAIDVPITITNFKNIGAVSLTLNYDSTVLNFNSGVNTGNFPNLLIDGEKQGTVKVAGLSGEVDGYSLQDSVIFFTLSFTYLGGTAELAWFDDGESCEYKSTLEDNYEVLNDSPQTSFYIDGSVSALETTPILSIDTLINPLRCADSGILDLNFTNVPDGYYSITYSSGSFPNVAVSANAAQISALAGTYNNLQIIVNGQSSPLGVTANLYEPDSPKIEILNNTGTSLITCNTPTIELVATGGENYLWYDGASEVSVEAFCEINSPGTYTVLVSGSNGCTSSDSIVISEDKSVPNAEIINNTGTTILNCNTATIEVTAAGGESYLWQDETIEMGTEANLEIDSAGIYTVTVFNSNGCFSSESIEISEDKTVPNAEIINNTGTAILDCNTTSIEVTATGGASYLWQDETIEVGTEAYLEIDSAGIYTVTVFNSNGCFSKESIQVSEDKSQPEIELFNNSGFTELTGTDTIIELEATGGTNYLWTVGNETVGSEAELIVTNAGTYTLTVTGANGCINTEVISITEDTTKTEPDIKTGFDDLNNRSEFFVNCYPNPFVENVTINYSLPCSGHLIIDLVSISGKRVSLSLDQIQSAGDYTIELDGRNLNSGVYLVCLKFSGQNGRELLKTTRVVKK